MRFFLDNNWPPRLARALHELVKHEGHSVVHLRDRFSESTDDLSWIETLCEEGDWVIITRDKLNKVGSGGRPERKVLEASGLTTFLFVKAWGHQYRGWDLIWRLMQWWPKVLSTVETIAPGQGFMVPTAPPTQKAGKLIAVWS